MYRAQIASIITGHLHIYRDVTAPTDRLVKKVKMFLEEHNNLLILRSYKGGITVAITNEEYNIRMKDILDDNSRVKKVNKDPTLSIQRKANLHIDKLKKKNILTDQQASKLKFIMQCAQKYMETLKFIKKVILLDPLSQELLAPL